MKLIVTLVHELPHPFFIEGIFWLNILCEGFLRSVIEVPILRVRGFNQVDLLIALVAAVALPVPIVAIVVGCIAGLGIPLGFGHAVSCHVSLLAIPVIPDVTVGV